MSLLQTEDVASMSLYESSTHSFIVKIWLEERADETDPLTWRGHITHVPSGQRRYLSSLDEVTDFIAIFLQGMGVHLGKCWQVRRWLRRKGATGHRRILKRFEFEEITGPARVRREP